MIPSVIPSATPSATQSSAPCPLWCRLAASSALAGGLLLAGCGEDPLGADNRMALLALGKCRHEQALQMTENAMQRGNEHNVQQALMLQAAILRDRGDNSAAQALYPKIAEAWEAVKRRQLTPERRERDIRMFIEVARDERLAQGLDPDCTPAQPRQPAAE